MKKVALETILNSQEAASQRARRWHHDGDINKDQLAGALLGIALMTGNVVESMITAQEDEPLA